MIVKQLIEKLSKLDQTKTVYLSDELLDEDTYYYKALDVIEVEVEKGRPESGDRSRNESLAIWVRILTPVFRLSRRPSCRSMGKRLFSL